MSDVAILAEGLSKQYRIGGKRERYQTMRDTLTNAFVAPFIRTRGLIKGQTLPSDNDKSIWALKDVSFEVKRGEVIGVIGSNGAGKSTLLKVLSRITEPSAGYADIYGRVGSLLEVGTGFHPELSGRENIYLSGSILGLTKADIKSKFDEIVEFAEVAKFIDTPIKRYSSGMYLRLAFSVAAHLQPDIFVVDEVLAVGDASFQLKCLGKMQEVGESGRTVLFVSHDMTAISRLAETSLYIQNGRVGFWGPTSEAIQFYNSNIQSETRNLYDRKDRTGDSVILMDSIELFNDDGIAVDTIGSGEGITIKIGYTSDLEKVHADGIALDMRFTDTLGHPVATFSTRFSEAIKQDSSPDRQRLICKIPSLTLAEEIYGIDLWLAYRGGLADCVQRAGYLRVIASNYYGTGEEPVKRKHGPALIKHEWIYG